MTRSYVSSQMVETLPKKKRKIILSIYLKQLDIIKDLGKKDWAHYWGDFNHMKNGLGVI